ncbi:MAG: fumarate hydratase [Candidatus Hodarchaeaceae archaeon]|nr:fumarate hydratase [Candidatus Hodarchaeaceae archaeon]
MPLKNEFRDVVVEMLQRAATTLPKDIVDAIERSRKRERNKIATVQFDCMLKNLELARKLGVPICQDTGIPIFFVKLGSELDLGFDLVRALSDAIKRAARAVPLRQNAVDPLTGKKSNAGQPIVHIDLIRGKHLQIDILIKGAGSENWSRLYMLRPTDGQAAIKRAVLFAVAESGGKPCPPTIVGVGVGGSADVACLLAKRALLRPLGTSNRDRGLADLELRLADAANEFGIGPMGLGGRTTVLGVHVEKAACHMASLPVAINFQCWAARRASARLVDDRLVVEVP